MRQIAGSSKMQMKDNIDAKRWMSGVRRMAPAVLSSRACAIAHPRAMNGWSDLPQKHRGVFDGRKGFRRAGPVAGRRVVARRLRTFMPSLCDARRRRNGLIALDVRPNALIACVDFAANADVRLDEPPKIRHHGGRVVRRSNKN